ncbi:hypothetical protein IEQ34_018800 [Dendrobium chrysotoxum]|uniref:Nucleoporin Nup133/Nup155-like N-terminal domain-containing protein n=1 Tax=Dendrobium chrysotoxum TaxID=161865 RepID=A0AAV7G518_DENCH|nr:hypothetical protein IEQ34_018800 [Dendrobium chrysotoxum]
MFFPQWPPVAEVLDTRELPAVLIERYNASGGEGTALCGIFPEIRRAWASVDNSLFLWRFDKRTVIHVWKRRRSDRLGVKRKLQFKVLKKLDWCFYIPFDSCHNSYRILN